MNVSKRFKELTPEDERSYQRRLRKVYAPPVKSSPFGAPATEAQIRAHLKGVASVGDAHTEISPAEAADILQAQAEEALDRDSFFAELDLALSDLPDNGPLNEAFDNECFNLMYELCLDFSNRGRKRKTNSTGEVEFPLAGFLNWLNFILPYAFNIGASLLDILESIDIHAINKKGELMRNAEQQLLSSLARVISDSESE